MVGWLGRGVWPDRGPAPAKLGSIRNRCDVHCPPGVRLRLMRRASPAGFGSSTRARPHSRANANSHGGARRKHLMP